MFRRMSGTGLQCATAAILRMRIAGVVLVRACERLLGKWFAIWAEF